MLVVTTIVFPIGLLIVTQGNFSKSTFTLAPLFLILFVVFSTIGSIKGRKLWKSYCLVLDESSVKKRQGNYPDLTIPFDKISKIVEQPGKGLIISSQLMHIEIHVPALISDYEKVRELLQRSNIKIETQVNKNNFKNILFLSLFIIAFATTLLSDNIWIISIAGIPFVLIMFESITSAQHNPKAPKFIKQWIWLGFLPLFTVVLRILVALIGGQK